MTFWKKERVLLSGVFFCVFLCLFLSGCNGSGFEESFGESFAAEETEQDVLSLPETEEETESFLTVHVCGEVNFPGVYSLKPGSRVNDAVEAAGGFTEGAAVFYLNLAALLTDGEKVTVPSEEEVQDDRYGAEGESGTQEELVNINKADEAELVTLTGIGPSKALAIIAYREENGAFASIEEIMNVSGIGEASFEKIADRITVGP